MGGGVYLIGVERGEDSLSLRVWRGKGSIVVYFIRRISS